MCAESHWTRCHRRLIAELLTARGHTVVHFPAPGRRESHRPWDEAESRDGKLSLRVAGLATGTPIRPVALNTTRWKNAM